jgi:hypothetical protein
MTPMARSSRGDDSASTARGLEDAEGDHGVDAGGEAAQRRPDHEEDESEVQDAVHAVAIGLPPPRG